MTLKHGDGFEPISTEEVFSAIIQHAPASRYVHIKPISYDAFLVHYEGDVQFATFAAFRSTVVGRGHIKLGDRIFRAIPWYPSYGREQT